ncbi:MAG: hypothetical protein VB023_09255 [Oscillibacter sp.]|nr:hypothetical protein [Oscillibacter sp.]
MNTLINQMPPALYVSILVVVIIAGVAALFISRHDPYMTKGMMVGIILILVSMVGAIVLKLKIYPASTKSLVVGITLFVGTIGFAFFFISGFLRNKKMGIKIDPTLKKFMIGCLIVILVCMPNTPRYHLCGTPLFSGLFQEH